jgi:hypothetical protein
MRAEVNHGEEGPYQDLEKGLGFFCCFPFFSGLGDKIKQSLFVEKLAKTKSCPQGYGTGGYGMTISTRDTEAQTDSTEDSFNMIVCTEVCFLPKLLLLSVRRQHQIRRFVDATNWSAASPQFSLGVQILRSGLLALDSKQSADLKDVVRHLLSLSTVHSSHNGFSHLQSLYTFIQISLNLPTNYHQNKNKMQAPIITFISIVNQLAILCNHKLHTSCIYPQRMSSRPS